jgi:acyl carrier protein
MSDLRASVRSAVFAAVDEINEQQPPEGRLEPAEETALFGEGGVLDSLGLVNFIVATEQELEEHLQLSVTLADERAMSQSTSPFATIGTLIDYTVTLAEEAAADR